MVPSNELRSGVRAGTRPSSVAELRSVGRDLAALFRDVLGPGAEASVRISLPDEAGRLRSVATKGSPVSSGRLGSARRRTAFETGRDIDIDLDAHGRTLTILPLHTDAGTLGVIEVVAQAERLKVQRPAILALVRQSAALLDITRKQVRERESERALDALLELTDRLNDAESPIQAARATAVLCFRHTEGPAAVARIDRADAGWYPAASAGLSPKRRGALRRALQKVAADRDHRGATRALTAAFEASVKRTAEAFVADPAVLIAVRRPQHASFMRVAASMLGRRLELLTVRSEASHDPGPRVDTGMVWAAHELRAPLVGARAALERVISAGQGPDEIELLRRTKVELDIMSSFVEPVLRWSGGASDLEMKRTDLMEIAHQAITSCRFGSPDRRIELFGAHRVLVDADAVMIRGAISNLIRNAVAYSPATEAVLVSVEESGSSARVCVEDRGPGIPDDERDALFARYIRGAAAAGLPGAGLGLFLARRVAEAHGGVLRLERTRSGARFCLELPVPEVRRRASAS